MAFPNWIGGASPITQVTRLTVGGTIQVGDLFIVTIGQKAVIVAAAATNATAVATAIAAALNALDSALYPEITGSLTITDNLNGTIDLRAQTAGIPFTVTPTTTESNGAPSNGQTFTGSTTTVASGPNFWSAAKNWSTGAVPANGDTVTIDGGPDILYGIDQNAVTLAALIVSGKRIRIGLPRTNAAGYPEYRERNLVIGATVIDLGLGPGPGSDRICLNTGSAQTTLTVHNSAQSTETGVKSICWKGTHASNAVFINKGSFAAAQFPGDTAVIQNLHVNYRDQPVSDADVYIGPGVTLTNIVKMGSILELNSDFDDLKNYGGETTIAAGEPGDILCTGGRVNYETPEDYALVIVGDEGEMDFRGSQTAITGTSTIVNKGAKFWDPGKRIDFTNPMQINCDLNDIELDLGNTFQLQRS